MRRNDAGISRGHARGWWVGLLCGALLVSQAAIGQAQDDVQTWHSCEVSKRFGATWELFAVPEIRIRDDASTLFYHEYRQGVRWKSSTHLQLGLNYLFVRNESSGKPREEHTGELDITPQATVGPLQASLRGRFALKTIQGSAGEQEWELRVMPKIAYPTQLFGHAVTPYVADDLFYNYTRDAWNQNRLFLGAAIPLGKVHGAGVGLDIYYMLQSQLGQRRDWNSHHIVGTKWHVRF